MSRWMQRRLVMDALRMAIDVRAPGNNLIHHSDRGSQYTSDDFRDELAKHHIECSMSSTGNCYDNAVAESFFGTLKTELFYRRPWLARETVPDAIAEYIEVFYNRIGRHSTIDYVSPAKFEEMNRGRAA